MRTLQEEECPRYGDKLGVTVLLPSGLHKTVLVRVKEVEAERKSYLFDYTQGHVTGYVQRIAQLFVCHFLRAESTAGIITTSSIGKRKFVVFVVHAAG